MSEKIIHGDSLQELKNLPSGSVDAVITDPPYGYSFMGKDWDKAVPAVGIWQECLRVLKPGGWCLVMSAPRSDVQVQMIGRLQEAGFRLDFTPIYWTYASGFPKAGNVSKLVDKRLGVKQEPTGQRGHAGAGMNKVKGFGQTTTKGGEATTEWAITRATSPQAKALDGSYAGFQPKPAVEVVIVAMKPLSEKTYVDQAIANGKGITWLDDCRIPTDEIVGWGGANRFTNSHEASKHGGLGAGEPRPTNGRFPANILVSEEALNGHSKFFDLDAWADTLPFLAVPKASKSEKNQGSEKNNHPTVKPLKLMSYLITLTTRPGDTVLDPFVGSGTTIVAAKLLKRDGIGIERDQQYVEIARARANVAVPKLENGDQGALFDDAA